jgi:adenine-specific DNA-methyltransferase
VHLTQASLETGIKMPVLQFKGKSFIENHHLTVRYHQLLPIEEVSVTDKVSLQDNLIIHGDNLVALKALLPQFREQVKCIYIDPPYNTGNEGWVYNDNVNSPMIREWITQNSPVDGEDLTRHDKWLCMMTPRLRLLRELLSSDGIILVSIDDLEVHHLRMLMDEIFGSECHLGTLVWKRRQNVDSRAKTGVSVDHEYILMYGKSLEVSVRGQEKDLTKYTNPDDDPRGAWASDNMVGLATKEQRPNLHYDLTNPETGITYDCPPTGWRYSKETMKRLIKEDKVLWPTNPDGRPRYKRFQKELTSKYTGFSTLIQEKIHNIHGTRELSELFDGQRVLDFPKPVDYIKLLIQQATEPDQNHIVLDSFAGSGTTAHAVLKLNREDDGDRQFILVEMEDYARTITAERVKRALQQKSTDSENDKLEGTFSFFELGDPIDETDMLSGRDLPTYENLARYIYYTSTGEEFSPKRMVKEDYFIGESSEFYIYLMYKPDIEFLRSAALTIEHIEAFPDDGKKTRLVFAPARYVDRAHLQQHNVKFVMLPFEIYQLQSKGS